MSDDWEKNYQEGNMPWDKGEAAPPLLEWLTHNEDRIEGEILAPGCGLGHDVRILAERVSGNVVGLDVSPTAVKLAQSLPASGGETYVAGDFFAPPAGWSHRFDWIWEHTCFCAIKPGQRELYVDAVCKLLKPGGHLLGVFYLNPDEERHDSDDGPPFGCTEQELRERFVKTGGMEWRESRVPTRTYAGREGRELLVRLRKP